MRGEGRSVNSFSTSVFWRNKKFARRCVFCSSSENLQTPVSLFKQLKIFTVYILGGNVLWKLRSWKIALS